MYVIGFYSNTINCWQNTYIYKRFRIEPKKQIKYIDIVIILLNINPNTSSNKNSLPIFEKKKLLKKQQELIILLSNKI